MDRRIESFLADVSLAGEASWIAVVPGGREATAGGLSPLGRGPGEGSRPGGMTSAAFVMIMVSKYSVAMPKPLSAKRKYSCNSVNNMDLHFFWRWEH
jgi:hypothetical protein